MLAKRAHRQAKSRTANATVNKKSACSSGGAGALEIHRRAEVLAQLSLRAEFTAAPAGGRAASSLDLDRRSNAASRISTRRRGRRVARGEAVVDAALRARPELPPSSALESRDAQVSSRRAPRGTGSTSWGLMRFPASAQEFDPAPATSWGEQLQRLRPDLVGSSRSKSEPRARLPVRNRSNREASPPPHRPRARAHGCGARRRSTSRCARRRTRSPITLRAIESPPRPRLVAEDPDPSSALTSWGRPSVLRLDAQEKPRKPSFPSCGQGRLPRALTGLDLASGRLLEKHKVAID